MLHSEAVPKRALGLLRDLCAHPALAEFALVGGTSLALRFGHRLSVDLDLFTARGFDTKVLAAELARDFNPRATGESPIGMMTLIRRVKVDFVAYPYPALKPYEIHDGIRMMSLDDVIGMKLSAICNRGAKKVFFDVHTLLRNFSAKELLEIYARKFPNSDVMIPLRNMIYFDDAEGTLTPKSLIKASWQQVKADIVSAVKPLL